MLPRLILRIIIPPSLPVEEPDTEEVPARTICGTCHHPRREHRPDGRWCWGERAVWDRGGTSECACAEFIESDEDEAPPPEYRAGSLAPIGNLDGGWFFFPGDKPDEMPLCATCGAAALGVARDGGPRYPSACVHPPVYPEKETQ